MTKAQSVC